MVADFAVRERVLDTSRSFIVQAPAGSGKTELLSNRFLCLLAIAEQPEDILALTFTKKAAGEMRHRILSFIRLGLEPEPPQQDYLKATWQTAKKVVQRDQHKQWHILSNPNRLRVQTIDSLCAGLAHQLPLLSRFGAMPEISEQVDEAYQSAVEYVLKDLDKELPWSESIYFVLDYLDNDWSRFHLLLANMLKKRSQWLPWVAQYSGQPEEREVAEASLKRVVEDYLSEIHGILPLSILTEFAPALVQAAEVCERHGKKFPISLEQAQQLCLDQNASSLPYWQALCHVLMTQSGPPSFRKSVTKAIGFPTKKDAQDETEQLKFAHNKALVEETLKLCHQHPHWLALFAQIQMLPSVQYEDKQWQLIHSLISVLKVAAGYLKIVFSETRSCDFTEISESAIQALGEADNPSEALLAIDYQVKHLLVDEYQDTNYSQNDLIEAMMSGWQADEGRSLFLVGDPMQSIYRFRDAEVGLFLNVCHQGEVANFPIETAKLEVNFRSSEKIVEWNNRVFGQIFPETSQVATGAVSYSPSRAFHPNDADTDIDTFVFSGALARKKEAEKIAQLTQQRLQQSKGTIAVLVRSRSHLTDIVEVFKREKIAFQAVDIDPLAEKIAVLDLQHLILALLSPSDMIAWYAMLRAPFIGLSLAELLSIHQDCERQQLSLYQWCKHYSSSAAMSSLSHHRLVVLAEVIQQFESQLGRKPLRMLMESVYHQLDGMASLESKGDMADIQRVFELLSDCEVGGLLENKNVFKDKIARLFAAADTQSDGRVQLMTIHKSKGLQFDTVIVPGLEHYSPGLDAQVLLWDTVLTNQGDENFIIGPMGYEKSEQDPVYRFLASLEKQRLSHENDRLLYVALTRAEKKLILTAKVELNEAGEFKKPDPRSMLSKIWPIIEHDAKLVQSSEVVQDRIRDTRQIRRLHSEKVIQPIEQETVNSAQPITSAQFDFEMRKLGQCIHRELQLMVEVNGYTSRIGSEKYNRYLFSQLTTILSDTSTQHLHAMTEHISQALLKVSQDEKGKWILGTHYSESKTEWPLVDIEHPYLTKHIIDRFFVDDDGVAWIVDYKSSVPAKGQSKTAFYQSEWDNYLAQLKRYRKLVQALGYKQVKLGLYFPLIQKWYSQ